jgi:hypothetical protein
MSERRERKKIKEGNGSCFFIALRYSYGHGVGELEFAFPSVAYFHHFTKYFTAFMNVFAFLSVGTQYTQNRIGTQGETNSAIQKFSKAMERDDFGEEPDVKPTRKRKPQVQLLPPNQPKRAKNACLNPECKQLPLTLDSLQGQYVCTNCGLVSKVF